jgi:hypothetical protein
VVLIAWGGRYEGASDNDKYQGHGTNTFANGDRCARHGRGVPGVSRGGAHAQRGGAWRAGSMRQDMTDAQACRGVTGAGAAGGGVRRRVGGYGGGYRWQVRRRMGQGHGSRCARHGRGVPGVSRGGAHAQRGGAWRAGSMRQDMTDAQVCARVP